MASHFLQKIKDKIDVAAGGGSGSGSGGPPPNYNNYGPPPHQQQAPLMGPGSGVPPGKIHVGYFTNWCIYGRKFHPSKIPFQHLTHVLYAFADVRDDGTVFLTDAWSDVEIHYDGDSWNDEGKNLYGNFKQLMRAKQHNRHVKLLLSIGGWTFSKHFHAVRTPQARTTFVQSAMKILEDVGLDGLDVDWEYPKDAEEAGHYVELLAGLRQALDARSHGVQARHWLSIAAPCGEQMRTLHVAAMDRYLDMWNLMSYDFAGTWSERATHHANVLRTGVTAASVDEAVQFYTSQGVAPHKLIIGMPLYARAFASTDGLGTPFNGVPQGGAEPGNFNYRDLPLAGHVEHFDGNALASFSTCDHKREFASYDSPASVDAKCDYIHRRGLGGVMWWEISGDADEERGGVDRALIPRAAARLVRLDDTPNGLRFPHSQYDNVRTGAPL